MTYTAVTVDDQRPASERAVPQYTRCYKLSTTTTADYILLPKDVKSVTLYAKTQDHWVRVDKVSSDPSAAKDLTTTKDNVIYVPAGGSFVIAQENEFNCISAKTASGTDTLYMYPGFASSNTGLVAEDLAA